MITTGLLGHYGNGPLNAAVGWDQTQSWSLRREKPESSAWRTVRQFWSSNVIAVKNEVTRRLSRLVILPEAGMFLAKMILQHGIEVFRLDEAVVVAGHGFRASRVVKPSRLAVREVLLQYIIG